MLQRLAHWTQCLASMGVLIATQPKRMTFLVWMVVRVIFHHGLPGNMWQNELPTSQVSLFNRSFWFKDLCGSQASSSWHSEFWFEMGGTSSNLILIPSKITGIFLVHNSTCKGHDTWLVPKHLEEIGIGLLIWKPVVRYGFCFNLPFEASNPSMYQPAVPISFSWGPLASFSWHPRHWRCRGSRPCSNP